ncbi:MAG: T9SS type A sorting domain-containing protein, partial [Bacteroidota bacterium]
FELSVGIDTEPQTTTEIYPNPTSGVLHIDSDGFQLARLYSLDGRMMIESRENIVDLSSLCKGVYLLKVTTSENVIFTSKIIKE